jgi:hypothetical protein
MVFGSMRDSHADLLSDIHWMIFKVEMEVEIRIEMRVRRR